MLEDLSLSPGLCAELACILEATARKPGNVTRFRDFEDSGYLDLLLAAAAIGRTLDRAAEEGVGRTILQSIERTRAMAGPNPNLGLVLLLGPLCAAAGRGLGPLTRKGAMQALAGLTQEDAELVYRAIRLARPGGLGSVAEEDVRASPRRPLVDAMALAADRDLIARQFANGFREVFEEGLPGLRRDLGRGLPLEAAIIRCHLGFLSRHPDSLIARKCGVEAAREASERAAAALDRGWPGPPAAEEALRDLDRWLREDGHRRNPGSSADLVGASLFPAIRNGIIRFPLESTTWQWKSTGCG